MGKNWTQIGLGRLLADEGLKLDFELTGRKRNLVVHVFYTSESRLTVHLRFQCVPWGGVVLYGMGAILAQLITGYLADLAETFP